jgi:hypothetical protein
MNQDEKRKPKTECVTIFIAYPNAQHVSAKVLSMTAYLRAALFGSPELRLFSGWFSR